MTDLELLNKALTARTIGPEPPPDFKPTHVTTYGSKNGVDGAFTTDLATGETVFSPLCVTFENDDAVKFIKDIWGI
jgi:hypothetical protein